MLRPSLTRLLAPLLFLLSSACDGCSDNDACAQYGIECGKSCVDNFSCAEGLYCSEDKFCSAECTPNGDECGEGQQCTANGQCTDGSGAGSSNGGSTGQFTTGGNGGGGDGGNCPSVQIVFEPTTPTVLLMVDQSGSMTESFGGGNRWDVLYETLMDSNDGIVAQLEDQVRFGFSLYTGDGDDQCPQLDEVSIALGNFDEIRDVYEAAGPAGETPTGDSITALLPQLIAYAEPGPKAIVLATDGEPDTCEQPNPQNGQAEAIAAAQQAHAAGVALYIIAVGGDVSEEHQQDMANAGVGLPLDGSQGNAPYYPANDQSALSSAFLEIINGVRSCVLTLDGTVDEDKAGQGHVYLDGNELGYDDPNGWRLNSPTEIELLGTSCEAIQEGDHTVTGDFDCGIIGPPPT